MQTTTITLRVPVEIAEIIRKYVKSFVVNTALSTDSSIRNINISNTTTVESKPTLDDVIAFVKERNSPVNGQRFFTYYEKRGWLDKSGDAFDWKQKLIEWESYNLEKSTKEKAEDKTKAQQEQAATIAEFLAESGKEAKRVCV